MDHIPRPREALQELEAHYSTVELSYNEELEHEWWLMCENDWENIRVTGESPTNVLIDGVDKKRNKDDG